MSASILPDGSVIFRLPNETVRVDVPARMLFVHKEPALKAHDGEPAGKVSSFPFSSADCIRLRRDPGGRHRLALELKTGVSIDLGAIPSEPAAMHAAWAVADATRCKIEIQPAETRSLAKGDRPPPSEPPAADSGSEPEAEVVTADAIDPYESPTRRLMVPSSVDTEPIVPKTMTVKPPPSPASSPTSPSPLIDDLVLGEATPPALSPIDLMDVSLETPSGEAAKTSPFVRRPSIDPAPEDGEGSTADPVDDSFTQETLDERINLNGSDLALAPEIPETPDGAVATTQPAMKPPAPPPTGRGGSRSS